MSRRLALVTHRDPPEAGAAAIAALARVVAPIVAELLGREREGGGLVDVLRTVPGPRRSILRACRSGAIGGAVKIARRWLAPRDAIDQWLATLGPRPLPEPDDGHDLDALRARLSRPSRPRSRLRASFAKPTRARSRRVG